MTPKLFLQGKKPRTDVERIACLAFFLTHSKDQQHFKTRDLSTLNTEAAQPKFSNASTTVDNATNQNGFLAVAGKGNKQITAFGEQMVMALPDYEKVSIIVEENKKRRRKKRAKKSSSKKKTAKKIAKKTKPR